MDDYLSEKEQIERIRLWWRENGWYLIAGVALAGVAMFGYNQYRSYSDSKAEAAAALYLDLQDVLEDDDYTAADALLVELRAEHPSSPYTDQAGLLMAGRYIARDSARAAQELRYVMESTDDQDLALITRLRLARVLIQQNEPAEALRLLEVDGLGPFAAQYGDARGDALYAAGDYDAARSAYSAALSAPGADWLNRGFVQTKIDSLDGRAAGGEEPGT